MEDNKTRQQVIVSMTSFPAAIQYAAKAVKSLLDGSVLPDKVVLYLTFSQFGEEGVPQELVSLAESNPVFEIRDYDRDIRSYRKLIPALRDFPDAVIVTVDDDVHYHRNMLRDLLRLHGRVPHAVLAHRAKLMRPGKPYRKWRKYRWYHFLRRRLHTGFRNIQTGVGGVLYPPHSLKEEDCPYYRRYLVLGGGGSQWHARCTRSVRPQQAQGSWQAACAFVEDDQLQVEG